MPSSHPPCMYLNADWPAPPFKSDLCPHQAVLQLPEVGPAEQAKDHLRLLCLQAQLSYALMGMLGDKRLRLYGYPHQSVSSLTESLFLEGGPQQHCNVFPTTLYPGGIRTRVFCT
jgi:hypothetical protein